MQDQKKVSSIDRRSFLKSAGVIGSSALFISFLKYLDQENSPSIPAPPVLQSPEEAHLQPDEQLVMHYFGLDFPTVLTGFFTNCANLGSSHVIQEQVIVDPLGHRNLRKYPGQIQWNDIRAIRGVTSELNVWEWRRLVETGDIANARVDGSITLYDAMGATLAQWALYNAWPSALRANPHETIDGDTTIEVLVLCHECLIRTL
jgi:phage tail-like protein